VRIIEVLVEYLQRGFGLARTATIPQNYI